jgi:mannose-6-phosphate isomerase-like protein (cupin superfamily)
MSDKLKVLRHAELPIVSIGPDATYQPIVSDATGADVPVRTGIQVSPPGFAVKVHSHPYTEILTVLEGRGEAWLDGEDTVVALEPGVSIMVAPGVKHAFRAVGDTPLVTFGVHAHGKRIVDYKDAHPAPAAD